MVPAYQAVLSTLWDLEVQGGRGSLENHRDRLFLDPQHLQVELKDVILYDHESIIILPTGQIPQSSPFNPGKPLNPGNPLRPGNPIGPG